MPSAKLYVAQAMRERLVQLYDGQISGYIKNTLRLLAEVSAEPLPSPNYLNRVVLGDIPCPRRLAANLVRVAERENLEPEEIGQYLGRYFVEEVRAGA